MPVPLPAACEPDCKQHSSCGSETRHYLHAEPTHFRTMGFTADISGYARACDAFPSGRGRPTTAISVKDSSEPGGRSTSRNSRMHDIAVYALPGFREPFSSLSHLLAAPVFAILGVYLVRRGSPNVAHRISLAVLAFSSVFLLSMSGIYHMLAPGVGREVFRQLDMAGIFVLIAGTCTPGYVIVFDGLDRWGPLVSIWLASAVGIALRGVFPNSLPYALGTVYFLLLGWSGAFAAFVVWRRHGYGPIRPLFWGGMAYTVGALLLELDWPVLIPGVIGPHEMWHVAVLVGLGLHWWFAFQIAAGAPWNAISPQWSDAYQGTV